MIVVAVPFGLGLVTGVTAGASQDPQPGLPVRGPGDRRVQRARRRRRPGRDRQRLRRRGAGLHRRPHDRPDRRGDPLGGRAAEDIEALAPGGDGTVWVGDIGDNAAGRGTVSVTRVPVGPGERTVEATAYLLRYPDGPVGRRGPARPPRDRPALRRDEGRLRRRRVRRTRASSRRVSVNRLRQVGRAMPIVTDGAFLPDGRAGGAARLRASRRLRVPLVRRGGRGHAPRRSSRARGWPSCGAAADVGRALVSSEGKQAPVYDVRLPVEAPTTAPTEGPNEEATEGPSTQSREGSELPEEPPGDRDAGQWLLGTGLAVVALLVLIRAVRPQWRPTCGVRSASRTSAYDPGHAEAATYLPG